MNRTGRIRGVVLGLAVALAAGRAIRAQIQLPTGQAGYWSQRITDGGERVETILYEGARFQNGPIEIRAERGILIEDRDRHREAASKLQQRSGLPRRGFEPPPSRRAVDRSLLRDRLRRFIGSLETKPSTAEIPPDVDLQLVRSFYFEGDVVFVHERREVLRASKVFFSLVDDRAVFENVEMRMYRLDKNGAERVIVARTDKLVRQGPRFVGRDISITTCDAGEPHFEMFSGEAEIIERGDEFEIRSRDNWLAFGGTRVVPLPNTRHFTGSASNYYIQGASAGYASNEGQQIEIDFGAPMHGVGGAVHEFLTGRRADEFRGDWQVGLGWMQKRGVTLKPALNYSAPGLYEGRTSGFWLDDNGTDFREIRFNVDGSLIDERQRALIDTENRITFNDTTRLDLTAWNASDPSVISEFYNREYINDELPETSAHFRHQSDNYRFSVLGRWNAADFAYGDNRQLTPRFIESQPVASFDLFSHEIATLPGDTPVLLTSATSFGQLESDFDPLFASPVADRTTRFDQEFEIATPFQVGGTAAVRPFVSAQYTDFSNTVSGTSRDRWAFSAGAEVGTRMSRSWDWTDGDELHALRHVLSPTVRVEHRFKVDGEPGQFHQFDEVDALDEGANIRLGLLQRFQKRVRDAGEGTTSVREIVWIDLAQNIKPLSDRDNAGETLGLGEFEFIMRPQADWLPLDNFSLLVEGEHDWDRDELRTFNTHTGFDAIGLRWFGGYRADQTGRGILNYGASLEARRRWLIGFNTDYDLEADEILTYAISLTRHDHDWLFVVGLRREEFLDQYEFSIDFVPTLGGLFQTRGGRGFAGDRFGGLRYTEF